MRKKFWTPMLFLAMLFGSSALQAADPIPPQKPQYGSFYTKKCAFVPPEHSIPFDEETVRTTDGINHPKDTGDFFIKEPGIYRVIYSVSLKSSGNVALKLDDYVIPGSEMYVSQANELSTIGLLIRICNKSCCEHKLQLVNNYPLNQSGWYSNDIILESQGNNITASFEIERVDDCRDGCCCRR